MTPRKICVVVTARPSYSRVKTVLTAIKNHPELELQLAGGVGEEVEEEVFQRSYTPVQNYFRTSFRASFFDVFVQIFAPTFTPMFLPDC